MLHASHLVRLHGHVYSLRPVEIHLSRMVDLARVASNNIHLVPSKKQV